MVNLLVLVFIIVTVAALYLKYNKEGFAEGGMAVSDRYCTQLADVYYRPQVTNPECRCNYRNRICGPIRRNTIDSHTGNYFTMNNTLV